MAVARTWESSSLNRFSRALADWEWPIWLRASTAATRTRRSSSLRAFSSGPTARESAVFPKAAAAAWRRGQVRSSSAWMSISTASGAVDGRFLVLAERHRTHDKFRVVAGPPAEGVQGGGGLPADIVVEILERQHQGLNRARITQLPERADCGGANFRLAIFQRGNQRGKHPVVREGAERQGGGEADFRLLVLERRRHRFRKGRFARRRQFCHGLLAGFGVLGLKPL